MMTNKTAKELLAKYNSGTISDEELAVLESWYNQQAKENTDLVLSDEEIEEELIKISKNLQFLKNDTSHVHIGRSKRLWYIAASILIVFTFGISYLFINPKSDSSNLELTGSMPENKKNDVIIPGDKRAILTLDDNTQIVLDDVEAGDIKATSNVKISKTSAGQLIYDVSSAQADENIPSGYNTISTPAGGEYQVKLSDGTFVFLNAKSSIKFPTIFRGDDRRVEISGEVYFDVSHNPQKPFIVQAGDQTIKVLGTEFNINSYSKIKGIKTTLIEGSVLVRSNLKNISKVLKPGQESILDQNHSKFSVSNVDLESAVAWKNGYFIFQDEELEDIMNQISRWYDVDIEYRNINKSTQFGGAISKYRKLEDVLSLLELTDKVKFKIQGRRIIIMN
ncbi:FecR family protein [Sphingobacterium bovistauri]|uniref:DUF4974 domain-containing protein n=1 Tax=Sphingobacterium bovistauri TaxID=2781959 RepID=A0ABS7Z349_9SPHI|nr:FecR family protein [Sphingobacterium bovistauri]MCA5004022.1 DUF4974 domain-containing protein [Sphingobacterium bovistauri]